MKMTPVASLVNVHYFKYWSRTLWPV